MHIFSQNNYKIENGGKKTFVIIPKSAKFTNVFFREWFPIYGMLIHSDKLDFHSFSSQLFFAINNNHNINWKTIYNVLLNY